MRNRALSVPILISLLAVLAAIAFAAIAQPPAPVDFAQAAIARGYTATVWIDSFSSPGHAVYGHGRFHPELGGDSRYDMVVTGSASLSPATDAPGAAPHWRADGTITAESVEGSFVIDLLRNGIRQDQARVPIPARCAPNAPCAVSVDFAIPWSAADAWSVSIRRGPEGSTVGERHQPLCDAMRGILGLPPSYTFTGVDSWDTLYIARPYSARAMNDELVATVCKPPSPTTTPTPRPTPAPTTSSTPAPVPTATPEPTPAPTVMPCPTPTPSASCTVIRPSTAPATCGDTVRKILEAAATWPRGYVAMGAARIANLTTCLPLLDGLEAGYVYAPTSSGTVLQCAELP